MKRMVLTLALACLLAGRANADTFTIDYDTALTFRQIFSTNGYLQGVFDLTTIPPTQVYRHPLDGVDIYPDNPEGQVGFVGTISGDDNWVRIGVRNGDFGTYTGLSAFIANDSERPWAVRLFANNYETSWRYLDASGNPGSHEAIELPFDEMALKTFGFDVLLDVGSDPCGRTKTTPPYTFDVSVAPVPAAALLGILGLGTAGVKLRKFV